MQTEVSPARQRSLLLRDLVLRNPRTHLVVTCLTYHRVTPSRLGGVIETHSRTIRLLPLPCSPTPLETACSLDLVTPSSVPGCAVEDLVGWALGAATVSCLLWVHLQVRALTLSALAQARLDRSRGEGVVCLEVEAVPLGVILITMSYRHQAL